MMGIRKTLLQFADAPELDTSIIPKALRPDGNASRGRSVSKEEAPETTGKSAAPQSSTSDLSEDQDFIPEFQDESMEHEVVSLDESEDDNFIPEVPDAVAEETSTPGIKQRLEEDHVSDDPRAEDPVDPVDDDADLRASPDAWARSQKILEAMHDSRAEQHSKRRKRKKKSAAAATDSSVVHEDS